MGRIVNGQPPISWETDRPPSCLNETFQSPPFCTWPSFGVPTGTALFGLASAKRAQQNENSSTKIAHEFISLSKKIAHRPMDLFTPLNELFEQLIRSESYLLNFRATSAQRGNFPRSAETFRAARKLRAIQWPELLIRGLELLIKTCTQGPSF